LSYLGSDKALKSEMKKWQNEFLFLHQRQPSQQEIEKKRAELSKQLKSEEALYNSTKKFVLDYARMFLLSSVKTSLGFTANARTLQEIISAYLYSPLVEEQDIGGQLLAEAKKLAPVLFSDEALVLSEDVGKERMEMLKWTSKHFEKFFDTSDVRSVRIITPSHIKMDSDRFNAATAIYPYVLCPFEELYKGLTLEEIKEILKKIHSFSSGNLHHNLSYSGLIVEICLPWHAYRDIFRHRRGFHSRQMLTTRLGYEIPEIYVSARLVESYKKDMEYAKEIYEKAALQSPVVAEKLVPFSFYVRALHSWDPVQISYVAQLRSNISAGHRSYVMFARELARVFSEIFPETAKYMRYDKRLYPPELLKNAYRWWDSEGKELFTNS